MCEICARYGRGVRGLLEAGRQARRELEESALVVGGRVVPQLLIAEDELREGQGQRERIRAGGDRITIRSRGFTKGRETTKTTYLSAAAPLVFICLGNSGSRLFVYLFACLLVCLFARLFVCSFV